LQSGYVKDSRINKEVNHARGLPTSDHEENMKIRRIPKTETLGIGQWWKAVPARQAFTRGLQSADRLRDRAA
jgi:hypothetical protein